MTTRRDFLLTSVAALQIDAASRKPVYLLTYDHGGLVLWGIPHFLENLGTATQWLDRYPRFKIGLDNEAFVYDYLAENDPAALKRIKEALEKYRDRFGIDSCTYGQPLMCFLNDESNIRQIQYAIETVQKHFNRRLAVYLMSEHAMHSQIPQILRGFGFWGAIMRTHFMMYGYNPTFDAPFGKWIGLDGSSIPAVPTYRSEGAQFGKTTVDDWILTRCPGPNCRGESLEKFRAQFEHLQPTIATRADDAALRREELVKEVEGDSSYEWVLLEDLPRVFSKPHINLPTKPNDFVVRMPWGYCGNEIWNRNREAEVSVLTAERAGALAWHAAGLNCQAQLDESWRHLLIAQHHDIQICGLVPDARKYLGESVAASERVLRTAMNTIASRMSGSGEVQITFFNPCSWRRQEWVEVQFSLPNGYAKALALKHRGNTVPAQLVSALRGSSGSIQQATLAIRADVPPLACVSYSLEPSVENPPAAAKPGRMPSRLETAHWIVELHADGGIAQLTSRKTGRPLFAADRRSAFLAGRINGVESESQGSWRDITDADNPHWIDLREHGAIGGIPYRCDMRLWRDSPRIDFKFQFEFQNDWIGRLSDNKRDASSPFLHEEKLRFKVFPALPPERTGIRDLPFAIAETPDRYIQGNYWTAIAGRSAGLAVFNRGTMALVREDDASVSVPLAYSMYYIWGTRILNGTYSYELGLWPFEGLWGDAGLHRHALEYAFPVAACASSPGTGQLGDQFQPVDVEADAAYVTALYMRNDQTLVRLFADSDRPATVHVRSGNQPLSMADLAGRASERISGRIRLRPWQIQTVALARASES